MEENNNLTATKNNKKLIVGITASVALVLVIIVGVLLTTTFLNNPQRRLAKGMANAAKEMSEYTSHISEDLGLEDIGEMMREGSSHINADTSFTIPNSKIENINIGVDALRDNANKKEKLSISAGTYGFQMDVGDIIADHNTAYISSPMFFKDKVYSVELDNIGQDFNNSEWKNILEAELPEDFSLSLFEDEYDTEKNHKSDSELVEIFKTNSKLLKENVSVKTIKNKRDFIIGEKTVSCGGVRVIVNKDACNEYIENVVNDILESEAYDEIINKSFENISNEYDGSIKDLKDELDEKLKDITSMRIDNDAVIDYYMDSNNRIVNISTYEDINVSSERVDCQIDTFSIDISFTGTTRTLDEITGGLYLKANEDIVYIGTERNADIDEETYSEDISLIISENNEMDIVFNYKNDWNYEEKEYDMLMSVNIDGSEMALSADGKYSNIVQGESYTFNINNAIFSIDGENLLILSAKIETEMSEETIEIPQNSIKLFEMSITEIQNLMYGAINNIG